MNFRILELDSYGHYYFLNSNMCLIPFICKSQLLLQTLLLHLPTLHTCFVILSDCLQASCILLQQLAYIPTLFFVLRNKFHILHLFSHCGCGFSLTSAVKNNTTVASANNHVDAPLTVYTMLNDHKLSLTFSKGPCSSSVYPYFHTHLLHLHTGLLSTTPELQSQLNYSACSLCLLLCSDTSFAPCRGERGHVVLSTKPRILFCDLRLSTGESKSCE